MTRIVSQNEKCWLIAPPSRKRSRVRSCFLLSKTSFLRLCWRTRPRKGIDLVLEQTRPVEETTDLREWMRDPLPPPSTAILRPSTCCAKSALDTQGRNPLYSVPVKPSSYHPLSATFADPDHSVEEDRLITVGYSSQGRLSVISHTERGDAIRIISARPATMSERKRHEN